jgi:Uma2 family endonuclease
MPTVYQIVQKTLPHPAPAYPPLPVRRFTVDEYHRLIQTGILRSGEPVELIHGWIVPKMPTNPTHSSVVRRLDRWFQRNLPNTLVVSVQQPITTADSEPEPDLAICNGPEGLYFTSHPSPEQAVIVIEVSDSSLGYDLGEKLQLYARAKVAVYWVVDLEHKQVIVHTDPRGGKKPTYRTRNTYAPGQSVPVTPPDRGGATRTRTGDPARCPTPSNRPPPRTARRSPRPCWRSSSAASASTSSTSGTRRPG